MADLHEYEITDRAGTTYTMQLTDDDAKRFPDARKVSGGKHTGRAEPSASEQHHEPVHDRARRGPTQRR